MIKYHLHTRYKLNILHQIAPYKQLLVKASGVGRNTKKSQAKHYALPVMVKSSL